MTGAAHVSPGITRLGDAVVGFYLVEQADGVVLVDAGLPRHRRQLEDHLATRGLATSDIRAVLLTHAHPDHMGLAEHVRVRAGADVWAHEADRATLRDGPRSALKHAKPERSMVPYLLHRPSALRVPLHLARYGAFTAPAITAVRTFTGEQQLEQVPGRPLVVPLPGHTPGSVAYLFPDLGVVFTGDALVTEDGLTGRTGPTLVCRGFTHDSATALRSLDTLASLPAGLALPGHGEPMRDGLAAAVDTARRRPPQ